MAIQRGAGMNVTLDDLHERIEFLCFDKERDSEGNIIDGAEHTRATVWAKVLPIAARIGDGTQETENIVTYRVTIRYREDIEPTDEILWRGKRLALVAPPYDVESRRIWTVLECRELVAGALRAVPIEPHIRSEAEVEQGAQA